MHPYLGLHPEVAQAKADGRAIVRYHPGRGRSAGYESFGQNRTLEELSRRDLRWIVAQWAGIRGVWISPRI